MLFYALNSAAGGEGQIAAYNLGTSERTDLFPGTTPRFLPTGHLVFWRDGALWAVPFDPDHLAVGGQPVAVLEGVASLGGADTGAYAVADDGTLAYLPAETETTTSLGWVDRNGVMTEPIRDGGRVNWPRLSPDGSRVLFHQGSTTRGDFWIRELDRGSEARLTATGNINVHPAWMPDGTSVTFARGTEPAFQLYWRPADLSREAALLRPTAHNANPGSWAPDGETLVYYSSDLNNRDIWTLPLEGEPVPFLESPFNDVGPRLSPNGKWLAYVSDQAGEDRVFVKAFPDGGEVFSVSTGSGTEVVWGRDGAELFYRSGLEMWAVDVETEGRFAAGRPRFLFEAGFTFEPFNGPAGGYANYDVSLDGEQFLMVRRNVAAEAAAFVVVENRFEELKRLVPVD